MDTDGRDSLFVNDRPHDDVDHAGFYRCFRPRLAWPGLLLLAFIRQNPAPNPNNYLYFLLLLNLNIMITITYIISILISISHSTITRPDTYPILTASPDGRESSLKEPIFMRCVAS